MNSDRVTIIKKEIDEILSIVVASLKTLREKVNRKS